MVKINPRETSKVVKEDMSKKCGIDLSVCEGGVQCYADNGETKHCNKCYCRVCVRGKCVPSLKVR